jgi:hypothetical protein
VHSIACRHTVVTEPAQELVIDSVPVDIQYMTLLTYSWITTPNRLVLMADPENPDSPQIKLFLECSGGFQTRDPALIAKTLHKDFRNIYYPRSLGYPEQTKEEFVGQWAGMMSLWIANPEVNYIGCSLDPFAVIESLPQETFRFIVDIPGQLIAHVRI